MVNFDRIEPLPHIVIQREPENPQIRPPHPYRVGVKPRSNRFTHGNRLKEQTRDAAQRLIRQRTSFGVDPRRLLILRLEVLDVNQRETLERFHVSIVEELVEESDGRTVYKLLVQFPDDASLSLFLAEHDQYASESSTEVTLPPGKRRNLYDALESVSIVTEEERIGRRLRREGNPDQEPFYLDVDLWNPGNSEQCRELIRFFREYVESRGGSIVKDPLVTPSMVLVKVNANLQLLNELLKLDLVSLVDLPPIPPPEDSYDFLQRIQIPDQLHHVPSDGPSACIVDSGVLAGHPLLNGTVVEEYDFDSGENTAVDLNGHGTQVGGLVVYGDIARRIPGNEWFPEVSLYSAKVLRNKVDPIDSTAPEAVFHDEERVEDQLRRAIVYFNQERGCRVFNLSIGHNDRLYTGGRQLPWAELLDELARTLDIVIIVAAGNVHDPEIPLGSNSSQFQSRVLDSLNTSKHKLIDPATSALSITVGAIARRDDPRMISHNTQLSATARGCPSAFTRCGPGVAGSVKPELVAPGGNFALELIAGRLTWRRNDVNLGEPTLNRSYLSGQTLRAVCGTSYSAAAVTHTAAQMEAALRNEFDVEPSQNLVRALLVSSANVDENAKRLVNGSQDQLLNLFGYGQPDVGYCWSSGNRVCIITEDSVEYRKFHVYSVVVPESFLSEKGKRSISVTLAYDPPTRLSRQDYISTAMWLEIFGGLTTEQIVEYRSKYDGEGDPPTVPDRNKLKFKPGGRTIRMSTVQKRTWRSNQGTMFLNRPDPSGDASLHVFVGCQPKYPNPYGSDSQRYALVITLQHDSQNIDIYQEVKTNIRTRTRIRTAV